MTENQKTRQQDSGQPHNGKSSAATATFSAHNRQTISTGVSGSVIAITISIVIVLIIGVSG